MEEKNTRNAKKLFEVTASSITRDVSVTRVFRYLDINDINSKRNRRYETAVIGWSLARLRCSLCLLTSDLVYAPLFPSSRTSTERNIPSNLVVRSRSLGLYHGIDYTCSENI